MCMRRDVILFRAPTDEPMRLALTRVGNLNESKSSDDGGYFPFYFLKRNCSNKFPFSGTNRG